MMIDTQLYAVTFYTSTLQALELYSTRHEFMDCNKRLSYENFMIKL